MEPTAPPELSAAIDRLWVRFAPEMKKRVAVLETVATQLTSKPLSAFEQEEAAEAAHKLAGVLGTFNLAQGTELARELELLLTSETAPDGAHAARLASIASELKSLIEGRQANQA